MPLEAELPRLPECRPLFWDLPWLYPTSAGLWTQPPCVETLICAKLRSTRFPHGPVPFALPEGSSGRRCWAESPSQAVAKQRLQAQASLTLPSTRPSG